jgi:integrase
MPRDKIVSLVRTKNLWRIDISKRIWSDAKPRCLSLGIPLSDTNYAELIRARIEYEIQSGEFDPSLQKYKQECHYRDRKNTKIYDPVKKNTLESIWAQWLEIKRSRINESTYQKKYKTTYTNALIASKLWESPINNINAVKLRDYLSENLYHGNAVDILREVGQAIGYAIDTKSLEGINPVAPLLGTIRNTKTNKIETRKYYTKNEVENILNSFKDKYPQYYLFTKFRFYTGLRMGESLELRWSDIDLDAKQAIISRAYDSITGNTKPTKTYTSRCLQLNSEALSAISELAHDRELIFTEGGYRISPAKYSRAWQAIVSDLYIDKRISVKLPPKNTRQTFINLALEAGVPQSAIAQQVGHSISTQNQSYRDYSADRAITIEI